MCKVHVSAAEVGPALPRASWAWHTACVARLPLTPLRCVSSTCTYAHAFAAQILMDPTTGRPKGNAFVRFTDATERDRAVTEMNGAQV